MRRAALNALPTLIGTASTIEEVLNHLPAEVRAQVAWTPKRLADISRRLLSVPVLSEQVLEEATDGYLEAIERVVAAIPSLASKHDLTQLLTARLQDDQRLIAKLSPLARKAFGRALVTVVVVGQLGLHLSGQFDLAEVSQHLTELDPQSLKEIGSLIRAQACTVAVLEGLKSPGPVPGRIEALCRRADEEALHFAGTLSALNPSFRMPWYFRDAPESEKVKDFAAWNPENQFAFRANEQPATAEELKAWSDVTTSIDANRPTRKLFS